MKKKELKYSRNVRMYREGYVSVCIYKNVMVDDTVFYDTVVYRKIRNGQGDMWIRGANFKPTDLAVLIKLLKEANEFLSTIEE